MRSVVFRVLAGLLALSSGCLLIFGDTSKMSLKKVYGTGVFAAGFGLYAVLGSELGERLILAAFGIRVPRSDRKPPEGDNHS
jgi:ABC-type Na+ transport system ATPase subunit NatA